MLQAGQKFPEFTLANQDNKTLALKDFAGKWLVVFIYPKDDTPGCTIESKGFSAIKGEFEKINTIVAGLSEDDVASHKNFCNKYSLTTTMLADPQRKLLNALGVGQTEYKGLMYWNRTTFVVDPKGMIRKVYEGVKPQDHERQVLEDVKNLQKSS